MRLVLLLLGLCCLGYYGYSLGNQYVYQAYGNWAFDQEIAGRRVTFADWLRERTPFAFLAGTETAQPTAISATASKPSAPGESAQPPEGSLLGRVQIARLNLSAIVRQGVGADTLRVAVGHVPSTALPGQPGNFAIAAHRDTLFRALKDIKKDDLVSFQSPSGTYTYQVQATEIVKPTNVSVLRPDGGGLISTQTGRGPEKLLTMITCYPFYYVGAAPNRFIVEAKLVSSDADSKFAPTETEASASPPPRVRRTTKAKRPKEASIKEPRTLRGSSRVSLSRRAAEREPELRRPKTAKKHGFWHKLFRP